MSPLGLSILVSGCLAWYVLMTKIAGDRMSKRYGSEAPRPKNLRNESRVWMLLLLASLVWVAAEAIRVR